MDYNPIITNIREVIFENFNDIDLKFNNDQIFQILKSTGKLSFENEPEDGWKNLDLGDALEELCNTEILRNIAQNYNTQWFKLFEPLEKINCVLCEEDNYLTSSEKRICQNTSCNSIL